jgi:hypothetical protein
MPLWTPNDLKQLQAQVQAAATTVNTAMLACTKLTATQQASWQAQYTLAEAYAAEDVGWLTSTGSTADQGQALLQQIESWRQIVNTACPGSAPVNLDPAPPAGLADTLQAAEGAALAAAAVLAIWFIGKAVSR